MERKRGDLEREAGKRGQKAQQHERLIRRERLRDTPEVGRARGAVHEREPVRHYGGRHAADQEELQGRLHRLVLPLEEARQDVKRNRHQLEGDEEKDQITGGREHQHPEERGQDEQVILAGAAAAREGAGRDAGEEANERRDQEEPLREDSQPVLDEHPEERRRRRLHEGADDAQRQDTGSRQPGDPAAIAPAGSEARAEHQKQENGQTELEREGHHGLTIRARSGTVAVPTGAIASPGTIPKRTSTNTRTTSATHSGPRASSRWGNSCAGGPQKIGFATRST